MAGDDAPSDVRPSESPAAEEASQGVVGPECPWAHCHGPADATFTVRDGHYTRDGFLCAKHTTERVAMDLETPPVGPWSITITPLAR